MCTFRKTIWLVPFDFNLPLMICVTSYVNLWDLTDACFMELSWCMNWLNIHEDSMKLASLNLKCSFIAWHKSWTADSSHWGTRQIIFRKVHTNYISCTTWIKQVKFLSGSSSTLQNSAVLVVLYKHDKYFSEPQITKCWTILKSNEQVLKRVANALQETTWFWTKRWKILFWKLWKKKWQ